MFRRGENHAKLHRLDSTTLHTSFRLIFFRLRSKYDGDSMYWVHGFISHRISLCEYHTECPWGGGKSCQSAEKNPS